MFPPSKQYESEKRKISGFSQKRDYLPHNKKVFSKSLFLLHYANFSLIKDVNQNFF